MATKKSTFRTSEPSRRTTVSRSFKRTYDSISGKTVRSSKTGRIVDSSTGQERHQKK